MLLLPVLLLPTIPLPLPCRRHSYSARVELSGKVLDCFAKLERTLCHELCHVAGAGRLPAAAGMA